MSARDPRPKVPQEVMDAALALVNTLAGNAEFRERIAEEEIALRVEAGELIPIDRLTMPGGLVLAPAGRLTELERAARVVVKTWMNLGAEQGWTDDEVILSRAVKHLAALFDLDKLEADPTTVDDLAAAASENAAENPGAEDTPVDDDDDVIEHVDDGEEHVTASTEVEKPEEAAPAQAEGAGQPGRPMAMPEKGDRGPCEECGAEITEPDQAQLSWILHRRKLCRACHVGDAEPEPSQQEDGDAAAGEP